MKRKTHERPEATRFTRTDIAAPAPGYTITNLSEADIQELNAGRVPQWVLEVTESFLAWNHGPAAGIAAAKALQARTHEQETQK